VSGAVPSAPSASGLIRYEAAMALTRPLDAVALAPLVDEFDEAGFLEFA
jgi:hypothetical protein